MQATSAGDAVLLGDDGLIPANLLPNTGGEQWERIAIDSTLKAGEVYKIRCLFGCAEFVRVSGNQSIFFPTSSNGGLNISIYRDVFISSNIISKFYDVKSTNSSLNYEYDPSDDNCRLYHLIE